jgi:HSP20 family protein
LPDRSKTAPLFYVPVSSIAETVWRPSVDIYRTRTGWLLKFDLAGVRLEDVGVNVDRCRITVSGVRRDWAVEEGCTYYSMEISYSRFERTVELPCDLSEKSVSLEGRNGLLIVRVNTQGEQE